MGNMQSPINSEGVSSLFLLCHRRESIFVALQLRKRKNPLILSKVNTNRSSVKELFGLFIFFLMLNTCCNHISQWPAFSWFSGNPVSRFCLAWPELNLSLCYDKQVSTCSVHWGTHCIFIPLPSYPDLSSQLRYFKWLRKKAVRSQVWRICVWVFQPVQQLKLFNSLFPMWKPELGLSPTQKSWDSEQPPHSSSSGLKENQKKINGNTYIDMYIAIKYSSKSALVEWTTLFLQANFLRKIRYQSLSPHEVI